MTYKLISVEFVEDGNGIETENHSAAKERSSMKKLRDKSARFEPILKMILQLKGKRFLLD